MSRIQDVRGRVVYDSRGFPTVEVEVETGDGVFRAIVPSADDVGRHDAMELRDGDDKFLGRGVSKAVNNVNNDIAIAITGMDPTDQEGIDQALIDLDGSADGKKGRLGVNAILGTSMAICRAGAAKKGIPLYKHINNLAGNPRIVLPVPCFNLLAGGRGAGNNLALREICVLPTGASSFAEAMSMGVEIYHRLRKQIRAKFGASALHVADEGALAPTVKSGSDAMRLVKEAIEGAGLADSAQIAIDVAANDMWMPRVGKYNLGFRNMKPDNEAYYKTSEEMLRMYKEFAANYDVISIEDPFHSEDHDSFARMTAELSEMIQIVGDELLASNEQIIERAVENSECNGLLLKLNQVGTITEAIDANTKARNEGFGVMVSHRLGDTEDTFIAAFCAGLATGQIKAGAPCRSERLAKYNELLRIESDLGDSAQYAGEYWRDPWLLPTKKPSKYM